MTSERAVERIKAEHEAARRRHERASNGYPDHTYCETCIVLAATPVPRQDGWDELRRAAEWLVSIHADDVSIPKGSALWEDLQSLKVALAAARGEPPEPGLDVERLDTDDFRDRHERAMRDHILGAPVMEPPDIHICSDLCSDSIIDRLLFGRARFGNEYPLATPTTPEPDPELELCPDCVGTGYVRHSGDMHFRATPEPDQ